MKLITHLFINALIFIPVVVFYSLVFSQLVSTTAGPFLGFTTALFLNVAYFLNVYELIKTRIENEEKN